MAGKEVRHGNRFNNSSGFTKLPSAIFLAFFAWLATRVVAKYGFGRP